MPKVQAMTNNPSDAASGRQKMRCSTCKNITLHELRFAHPALYADDEDYDPAASIDGPSDWERREYRVWVCLGCDNARFEIVYLLHGPEPEEQEISVFYPENRREEVSPKLFYELNENLETIYNEVIKCYNSGLLITCAIGVRALLEGICVSKGITDEQAEGLEGKLKLLCEQKYVPATIINALLGLKTVGDSAAHRLDIPRQVELRSAIELVDLLLEFMYEMEPRILDRAEFAARLTRKRLAEEEERKAQRKERRKNKAKAAGTNSPTEKNEPGAG
jgi:hypothetical protein